MSKETYIHPTAIINNCVTIGKGCYIDAGVVIGFQGLIASRNKEGIITRRLSTGGTIIEDNVWIGAGTIIQRGHTKNTIIGEGTYIDVYCMIGHECKIGKHCLITAGTLLAGHVGLGDYSYLGVGCIVRDGRNLGQRVFVGMGAVVTKDIPDNWVVAGSPAMRIERFKEQRRRLERISPYPLKQRIKKRVISFLVKIKRIFKR